MIERERGREGGWVINAQWGWGTAERSAFKVGERDKSTLVKTNFLAWQFLFYSLPDTKASPIENKNKLYYIVFPHSTLGRKMKIQMCQTQSFHLWFFQISPKPCFCLAQPNCGMIYHDYTNRVTAAVVWNAIITEETNYCKWLFSLFTEYIFFLWLW